MTIPPYQGDSGHLGGGASAAAAASAARAAQAALVAAVEPAFAGTEARVVLVVEVRERHAPRVPGAAASPPPHTPALSRERGGE